MWQMAHLEGISSRVLIRKQTQGPKATPSTRVLSKKKQAPALGVGATRALSSKSLKVAKLEKTVQKRAKGVLVQEDKAEIPKKRRSIQRLPLKEEANSEEQQADSPGREECFQRSAAPIWPTFEEVREFLPGGRRQLASQKVRRVSGRFLGSRVHSRKGIKRRREASGGSRVQVRQPAW
jgi:hypothetical protein